MSRRATAGLAALWLAALSLLRCAGVELQPPPHPDAALPRRPVPAAARLVVPAAAPVAPLAPALPPEDAGALPSALDAQADAEPVEAAEPVIDGGRCGSVPPLGPEGEVPPAPPHLSLGVDVDIPGDRSAYVLPGDPGDARVIVYLHGMCGDVAAADYFREAVRQHGTLLALRGDTLCAGDRFKWRDDPPRVLERIRAALKRVNDQHGTSLSLKGALLFGYSQGADRAEKLAAEYPKLFPRVVLGGPPMRASPLKLGRAARVAILGGELETTDTMHEGADALTAAGISCRFFTLECAYHGYYGINAEAQLAEVLAWVSGS